MNTIEQGRRFALSLQELARRRSDLTARQDALRLQAARLEDHISRLLDALEAGDSASIRDCLAQREHERAAVLGQLAALEQGVEQPRIKMQPDLLCDLLAPRQGRWPNASQSALRPACS